MLMEAAITPPILRHSYPEQTRSTPAEQFIPDFALSYQLAGTLLVTEDERRFEVPAGRCRLVQRNRLVRFVRKPAIDGPYRSVSVRLDQALLRQFSAEHGCRSARRVPSDTVISLPPGPALDDYIQSLQPCFDMPATDPGVQQKQKEGIALLLQIDPFLENILFDFADPERADLRQFMELNFQFNVPMERFAFLSGRSLSTFKRDFLQVFGTTPGRWLQQRRLEEARRWLQQGQRRLADVYTDLGFEDLSHFSYAFKKAFGVPPSRWA
jgi:AraC-like DNA-binding protein